MSIDTGLGLTYKENYPIPGMNQSSQQFRDNFAVIREAFENLHAATQSSGSVLALRMDVSSATGEVTFVVSYPDGTPSTPGTLRYQGGGIEYWTGSTWAALLTANSVTATQGTRSIVGAMLGGTQAGLRATYDSNSGLLNFDVNDFTVTLDGAIQGSARIANLANTTLTTTIDPTTIRDVVGAMVTGTGIQPTYANGALSLAASDFDISLSGAVNGRATVNALGNTSIVTSIDSETVQDIVGAMVIGSTQTNLRVTYDDDRGKLSFATIGDAAGRNAVSTATPSTVVLRDANGSFTANTITATVVAADVASTKKIVAERFHADADTYGLGTVLVYGGPWDVTATTTANDTRVAGVVVTTSAYALDSSYGSDAAYPYVALLGRAECRVVGRVSKGDLLTTSTTAGCATKAETPTIGAIIGKALESKTTDGEGVIEIVIQRS